jgi:hypothetical protein
VLESHEHMADAARSLDQRMAEAGVARVTRADMDILVVRNIEAHMSEPPQPASWAKTRLLRVGPARSKLL